jgi:hypothetical protein
MRKERFREAFDGWTDSKNFAAPETTKERLEKAGFEKIETWLHEEPTEFDSVEKLARYLKTVILRQHVEVLAENERHGFVRTVAERLAEKEEPVVDYVRLNMLAWRSSNESVGNTELEEAT